MAKRVSKKLLKNSAQLVHTNTGGTAMCSLNAYSRHETNNPQFSFAVTDNANVQLNYTKDIKTLNNPGSIIYTNFDTETAANYVEVSSSQRIFSYNGTSQSNRNNHGSYTQFYSGLNTTDVPVAENPDKIVMRHRNANNNDIYAYKGLSPSEFVDYMTISDAGSFGGGSLVTSFGASYYDQLMFCDPYYPISIMMNSNSYMTVFEWDIDNNTNRSENRSSDSLYYQNVSTNYNSSWNTAVAPSCYGENRLYFMSLGSNHSEGNDVVVFDVNYAASSVIAYYSRPGIVRLNSFTGTFNWLCYNPITKKHIANIFGTTNGIYEIDPTAVAGYTQANVSITNIGAKVGNTPGQTEIPIRIGKNLYRTKTVAGTTLYSTDLITWVELSSYTEDPAFLEYYEEDAGNDGRFITSSSIVDITTGFDDINEEDVIEYKTYIGHYEKTNFLMNKGDSLYAENLGDNNIGVSLNLVEV